MSPIQFCQGKLLFYQIKFLRVNISGNACRQQGIASSGQDIQTTAFSSLPIIFVRRISIWLLVVNFIISFSTASVARRTVIKYQPAQTPGLGSKFISIPMKKHLCIFLVLFFPLPMLSQSVTTTGFNGWTSHNLNGNVKKLKSTSFIVESEKGSFSEKKRNGTSEVFEFSKTGIELSFKIFDERDSLLITSIPLYQNNIIVEILNINSKNELIEKWVPTKYALGFYGIEIEGFKDNKLIKKIFNKVNIKGHRTEMKIYNSGDSLLYSQELEYDKNESLLKVTIYEIGSTTESMSKKVISYKYTRFDRLNNWIERFEYSNNMVLMTERIIEYY